MPKRSSLSINSDKIINRDLDVKVLQIFGGILCVNFFSLQCVLQHLKCSKLSFNTPLCKFCFAEERKTKNIEILKERNKDREKDKVMKREKKKEKYGKRDKEWRHKVFVILVIKTLKNSLMKVMFI